MDMQRTSRPGAHQELVWRFTGAAIGMLCLAVSVPLFALNSFAALRAGLVIIGLVLVSAPSLRLHGRRRLGPANLVTLVRAVLVAWVAAAMDGWTAPALAAVALALDGVDGYVARLTGWSTRFGAELDMELDALFTLLLSVLVWVNGAAGAWVLLSGAMRYLFVAAGWVLPWMKGALPPRYRRKVVCVVQIGSLLVCLIPVLRPPLTTAIAAVGLFALLYSFGVDVWLLYAQRRRTP